MPNKQSFISVPADFKNMEELRYFLVRLVVELDELIGNRGDDSAALSSNVDEAVVQLDRRITSQNTTLQAYANSQATNAVTTANDYTDNQLQAFAESLEQTVEVDLDYTPVAASVTYEQAEVQQIADDVGTVANKIDAILAKLRLAGIIAEGP
jgi:predicted Rossmann fold nucleotide-binding protein DprA/Smf involved in DNA uptake